MAPQGLGFVGVGNLGAHLAASLLRAGFGVAVHDLDRDAGGRLLDAGATWADSPREAAEGAEAVITCLPSPAAIEAVVAGEAGVFAGLAAGGTWIDMSTNDPEVVQRLAETAAVCGIATLEAPLTGGVHLAASGRITVLVGGDEAVFEARRPVLEAMGGAVIYVGPLGSASTVKIITNLLALTHVVVIGEALMLARRSGIDLGRAYEAIKASSGNSFVHETESPLILSGSYNVGFTMDLACKDLGLASKLAARRDVPLELGALVEEIFVRARAEYGGDAWSTMVVKLLEDAVDTDLRAPAFTEASPE